MSFDWRAPWARTSFTRAAAGLALVSILLTARAGRADNAPAPNAAPNPPPGADATPADALPPGDDAIGRYLAALAKDGRLTAETASLDALKNTVIEAETRLVHGDARAATTSLYGVVESPRYAPFAQTPAFENAEYLLGRALLGGRAYRSAERYLVRALARGPQSPYFVPSYRALVDLALETHGHARMVPLLEGLKLTAPLPVDSALELAYLRGKVAYDQKDFATADARFHEVSRRSRLYPAALYFEGLIAARQGNFNDARGAFCQIANQKTKDRVSFNIDSRFFLLQDLAHLALGRIAHEQDKYDEAYYFYFSVPDDSDRLPEALFEASWSMYQKGEFVAARAFADELDRLFPHSPLRPELAIMRANLAVKTCAFDRARGLASALVTTYRPIEKAAAAALADPDRRRALFARLLSREQRVGASNDEDGQLLELLKLDERFADLYAALADLDVDLAEATRSVGRWRALGARARTAQKDLPAANSPEAVQILEDTQALAAIAPADPALGRRLATLELDASLAAYPPSEAGPYAAEARASEATARKLAVLRERMTEAAHALAHDALTDLDNRLRAILRQVRLVHIDAVVGKKKKLEIEIAGLNEGKIPPSLFRTLQAEGVIADDEIYWPFEGELWSDEYENFK